MKLIILILIILVSINLNANEKLYKLANAGNIKAQENLMKNFKYYMNKNYDINKSNFWGCQALMQGSTKRLIGIKKFKKECPNIIKEGKKKKYHIYYAEGTFISSINPKYNKVVPNSRIWKIEWKKSECDRVCTAEMYIIGQIAVGENKDIILNGKFDINANSTGMEIIWLYQSGKIRFGDSKPSQVSIKEYAW